ncbi:MAG: hypothetical protein PHC64_04775 [Candidatus Gastranaerophilales bacterium]|nr:hypothetical protein [Candidatus Gastranaerophilales bacterium]
MKVTNVKNYNLNQKKAINFEGKRLLRPVIVDLLEKLGLPKPIGFDDFIRQQLTISRRGLNLDELKRAELEDKVADLERELAEVYEECQVRGRELRYR